MADARDTPDTQGTTDNPDLLSPAGAPSRSPLLKQLVFGLAIVAAFSAIVMFRGRTAPTPEVFLQGVSLVEALDQAGADGKPVFAGVTADWCPPCQSYKRGALADARVQEWLNENAVAIMLDADTLERSDAMLLNFGGSIPATALLIDERTVGTIEGSVGAGALIDWLEADSAG